MKVEKIKLNSKNDWIREALEEEAKESQVEQEIVEPVLNDEQKALEERSKKIKEIIAKRIEQSKNAKNAKEITKEEPKKEDGKIFEKFAKNRKEVGIILEKLKKKGCKGFVSRVNEGNDRYKISYKLNEDWEDDEASIQRAKDYWANEVYFQLENIEDLSQDERILNASEEQIKEMANDIAQEIIDDEHLWGEINDTIEWYIYHHDYMLANRKDESLNEKDCKEEVCPKCGKHPCECKEDLKEAKEELRLPTIEEVKKALREARLFRNKEIAVEDLDEVLHNILDGYVDNNGGKEHIEAYTKEWDALWEAVNKMARQLLSQRNIKINEKLKEEAKPGDIGTQIGFSHDENPEDETEFDTPDEEEAKKLFNDFIKENGYQNVKIIYIEHRPIEESLKTIKESRGKGFVKKYKGYSIIDVGDRYVITDKHGLNVGETKFGLPVVEGMIDLMIDNSSKDESLKENKETQEQAAFENACDCLKYGYGKDKWNSCGLSKEDADKVWKKAFDKMSREESLKEEKEEYKYKLVINDYDIYAKYDDRLENYEEENFYNEYPDDDIHELTVDIGVDSDLYELKDGQWVEIENFRESLKEKQTIKESFEKIYIKYWEDEELRDQGISEIYEDDFATREEAIEVARKLVDRDGMASVEVFVSPSGEIESEDDKLIWGYDGVDTWKESLDKKVEAKKEKKQFAKKVVQPGVSFSDDDINAQVQVNEEEAHTLLGDKPLVEEVQNQNNNANLNLDMTDIRILDDSQIKSMENDDIM